MKAKNIFFILFIFFAMLGTAHSEELIIYTRLTNGYWQLWMYNPATKVNFQITEDKTDKRSPFYCTKEDLILYRTPDGKLFSHNPETKEARQLYKDIQYIADAKCYNGELLFTRYRTDVKDDSDIWLVDLKTDKIQVLTQQAGLQYHPALLNNKETLLYISGTEPDNHHIFRKKIDSGKVKQLTFNRGYQILPVFSPDNKRIVFVSDVTGDYEIWRMDLNGKNKKQLTDHKGIDSYPCWSPDGEKIVYVSYSNGKYCLMVMDGTGKNKKLLFECEDSCSEPQWVKFIERK